ncbi:hypothetical protein SEA_MODRAGONS_74 [Mycobacterium phage Modragons]|nr:hypothetical protein SEA_MODRAGONS_74 [Mycobacterium phage Modragons]
MRDDSVSEGEESTSVQFGGNPISHSIHTGFARPMRPSLAAIRLRNRMYVFGTDSPESHFEVISNSTFAAGLKSLVVGVCQNEQPLTCVWGTHGTRG